MKSEKRYLCPLLNKHIYEGYCFDINAVLEKWIKKEALSDEIDMETAKVICDSCNMNALSVSWDKEE